MISYSTVIIIYKKRVFSLRGDEKHLCWGRLQISSIEHRDCHVQTALWTLHTWPVSIKRKPLKSVSAPASSHARSW